MSEYYMGQILLSGFNFAPRGFAFCNGQIVPISQYTAVFSLLGITYGGNGQVTFGLPDLRGRTPVGAGSSAGGGWQPAPYAMGEVFGNESVTLTSGQLPQHTHQMVASNANGTQRNPTGTLYGKASESIYASAGSGLVQLNKAQMQPAGNNQSHPNMQPFNVLNFSICMSGMFPSRG